MIVEAIQHFFNPAPEYIKKMGYLQETIAIEKRAKRCFQQWQSHLDKCKSLILKATHQLRPRSEILILGSGGLHDVPMDQLLKNDFFVSCVDIVHLPRIKKIYPKVNFVERDITGLVKPLYLSIKNGGHVLADPEWEFIKKPDLIVSLNLLSQLSMKMVAYAEKNGKDLGLLFHKNVLKDHINWLLKQNTKILLISDIEREYFHNGMLIETVGSLPKLPLKNPDETWYWDIAPKGEADKEISIRHKVGSWKL